MTENGKLKDIKVKGHISIGGITLSINETISMNEEESKRSVIQIGKDAKGIDLGTLNAIAVSFGKLEEILQEIKGKLEGPNAGD